MKSSKTVELSVEAQDAIEVLIEIANNASLGMTRYHKLEVGSLIELLRKEIGDFKRVY